MKKSGVFVASMAAVSASAISTSSPNSPEIFYSSKIQPCREEGVSSKGGSSSSSQGQGSSSTEKFAPRFDGLRFIETLVTAHR